MTLAELIHSCNWYTRRLNELAHLSEPHVSAEARLLQKSPSMVQAWCLTLDYRGTTSPNPPYAVYMARADIEMELARRLRRLQRLHGWLMVRHMELDGTV